MARSSLEKSFDKQQKDAKRAQQKTELRERASAIVNARPLINGFRLMDSAAEEALSAIMEFYNGNDQNQVQGNDQKFPAHMRQSTSLEFEKLLIYGMLSTYTVYIGSMWTAVLTQKAKTYFSDKETAEAIPMVREEKQMRKQYDVFVSHASRDKLDYVGNLYMALRKLGISIFYDSDVLSWGDNWKEMIISGTDQSEFAIVVISDKFFGREWTERELNEFLQRQNETRQKIILPLLHNISFDELRDHYPALEAIQAIKSSDYSVEEIAIQLAKELIKRYR